MCFIRNIDLSHLETAREKIVNKVKQRMVKVEELMIRKKALQTLGFNVIGTGAEKIVILPSKDFKEKLKRPDLEDAGKVYYFPVRKFILDKASALLNEVKKMKNIEDEVQAKGGDTTNLALKANLIKSEKFSYPIVEVDAADADFEKAMNGQMTEKKVVNGEEVKVTRPLTIRERISLGKDMLSGGMNLHLAGYSYQDYKPENCLIYKKEDGSYRLKIADFGKASKKEDGIYTGNLRFAPPEGKPSQKGDVWSFGLGLIRAFEEDLERGGKPLVSVTQNSDLTEEDKKAGKKSEQDTVPALESRRGVERYIVNHKAFSGIDEPSLMDKLFRRFPRMATLDKKTTEEKQLQQTLMHNYVDELGKQLKNKYKNSGDFPDQKVDALCSLLKNMLVADPKERITLEEAFILFDNGVTNY